MDQFYYSVLILLISSHSTSQGEIPLEQGDDALVGVQQNASVSDLLHNDSILDPPINHELFKIGFEIPSKILDTDPQGSNNSFHNSDDLKSEAEIVVPVLTKPKVRRRLGNNIRKVFRLKPFKTKNDDNVSKDTGEYGDEKSASYRQQIFIEHPINPRAQNPFNNLPTRSFMQQSMGTSPNNIYPQPPVKEHANFGYSPVPTANARPNTLYQNQNQPLAASPNSIYPQPPLSTPYEQINSGYPNNLYQPLATSEPINSEHIASTDPKDRPKSDFFSQNFRRPLTSTSENPNILYQHLTTANEKLNSITNSIYPPKTGTNEQPGTPLALAAPPQYNEHSNSVYSPEVTGKENPNTNFQPAVTAGGGNEYPQSHIKSKTKESFQNLYSKKSFGQSRSNSHNQKSIFPATAPAGHQNSGLPENPLKFNANYNQNEGSSPKFPQRSIFPATAPAEQQNIDIQKTNSNEEPRWKRKRKHNQDNFSQQVQLSSAIRPEIGISPNFQQVVPSQFSFPQDNPNPTVAAAPQVTPAPLVFKFNPAGRQQGTLRPISFPPNGNKNNIQQPSNLPFRYNNQAQAGPLAPIPQGAASPTTFQPNYNYNYQPPGRPGLQFPQGNVQQFNNFQTPTSIPFQGNYNGLPQSNVAQQPTSSPGQSNFFPNGQQGPINVFVQNAGQRTPGSENPPVFRSQSQSQGPQDNIRNKPQSTPSSQNSIFPQEPQEITVKFQQQQEETTTTRPFALQQQFNNYPQQFNNNPQQFNNNPQQFNNNPQQFNNYPQQFAQQQYVQPRTAATFGPGGLTASSVNNFGQTGTPLPSGPAFQQYPTQQIYTNLQQRPQVRSFSHPDVPFTGPRPFPTAFPMNTVQQFRAGLPGPYPNPHSPGAPFYQRPPQPYYTSTPGNPAYQNQFGSTFLPSSTTTPSPAANLLTKPFKIEIEIPPFKPADLEGYIPSKTGANYTMPDLSTEVIKYPVEFKETMLHHQWYPKDGKQPQTGPAPPAQYNQNSVMPQYNHNSGAAQYNQNSGATQYNPNSGVMQYNQNSGAMQYNQNSGAMQYNPNSGPAQYNQNLGAAQYNLNLGSPQYNQNSASAQYNPNHSGNGPLSNAMGLNKDNYRTKKVFKRKPKDEYNDPQPTESESGDLSKENNSTGNGTQSGEYGQVSSGTFTYLSRIFGITTTTPAPRLLSSDIVDIRQIFFTPETPKVEVVKRSSSPKPEKKKSSKSNKKKDADEQQMESQDTPAESQADSDGDDSEAATIEKNGDMGKNEVDGNTTLENATVELEKEEKEKEKEKKSQKAKNISEKLKKVKADESPEDNTAEEEACKSKKSKKSEEKVSIPPGAPEVQVRILWPKDGKESTSGNTDTTFKTITPLQVLANSYPQLGNTMRPQEGLVSNNLPYNELALRHEIPFHSESQKRPQESTQQQYKAQSVVTQAPAPPIAQVATTESPGIARSVGKLAGGVVRNVSRMVQFFG